MNVIRKYILNFLGNFCFSFTNTWLFLHIIGSSKYIKNIILQRRFNCSDTVSFHGVINSYGEEYINIGPHSQIGCNVILTAWDKTIDGTAHIPQIIIGSCANIGDYTHITSTNCIVIGDNLLTGRWVTITDNSHGSSSFEDMQCPPLYRPVISKGSVKIGKNVWIGDKATILPNVTIGDGAIIAANSVVTKNIPAFSVVAGNPARVVKMINR